MQHPGLGSFHLVLVWRNKSFGSSKAASQNNSASHGNYRALGPGSERRLPSRAGTWDRCCRRAGGPRCASGTLGTSPAVPPSLGVTIAPLCVTPQPGTGSSLSPPSPQLIPSAFNALCKAQVAAPRPRWALGYRSEAVASGWLLQAVPAGQAENTQLSPAVPGRERPAHPGGARPPPRAQRCSLKGRESPG